MNEKRKKKGDHSESEQDKGEKERTLNFKKRKEREGTHRLLKANGFFLTKREESEVREQKKKMLKRTSGGGDCEGVSVPADLAVQTTTVLYNFNFDFLDGRNLN